jgi:formylglycine-generating enzyme required for sulfatase activity
MKTVSAKAKVRGFTLVELFVVLAVLTVVHQVAAQSSQFFRISGPAATTITAFNPDGTLVWSNAQTGTNYIVQTVSTLPGGTNWVDYVQIPVTNDLNTNLLISFNPPAGMTLIPAGVFTMGNYLINGSSITNDPAFTDAIATNVYVSAFYMDVNLISYSQWQSVYNWATNNGYTFVHAGSGKAANHPVQMVDWFDCVKWCNARSQQAGLTPVYYANTNFTLIYTNGETTDIYANWLANGYRLPTEAEWEKAARGRLGGQRFPWGNTISESEANYYSTNKAGTVTMNYDLGPSGYNAAFTNGATPFTSPVGSFAANGYGLYEMAGNVDEWCWDWYKGPPYPTGSPYLGGIDPHGSSSPSFPNYRVLRGSDWGNIAFFAQCSHRGSSSASFVINALGFRCVKGL